MHPAPLQSAPAVGLQLKSTVAPPANVITSSDPPTRNVSTEEWIEEVAKDVPMNVDSSLAQSEAANLVLEFTTDTSPGEPPFFLNHDRLSSADGKIKPSDHFCQACQSQRDNQSPRGIFRRGTRDSIEDYRSVIDDLTVENRLLRQKLERYERLHCSHLQHGKLFEVKIHGLPDHKKRELEQALRRIVAGLEEPAAAEAASKIPACSSKQDCQVYQQLNPKSTPADSAYASTSASEHTLNTRSRPNGARLVATTGNCGQDVSSHVQEFSPAYSMRFSQSFKRKAVVEQLEQLFTGKSAKRDQVICSHQQQRMCEPMTMGEKHTAEGNGLAFASEGAREAKILPTDMDSRLEHPVDQPLDVPNECNSRPSTGPRSIYDDSPYQRPTRPIDLDIHQAQDAAYNMNYIRHLGLGLPAPHAELAEAENGWVFLNLLFSMAQLHTLNVTLDFVRKAVTDLSSKLELSSDGQQVRWCGPIDGPSSGLDPAEPCTDTTDFAHSTDLAASPGRSIDSSHALRTSNVGSTQALTGPRIQCDLLRDHINSPNDHSSVYKNEKETWPGITEGAANTSCGPSAVHTSDNPGHNQDQGVKGGPIIFYSSPNFCTDLSGNASDEPGSGIQYTRCSERPLGKPTFDAAAIGPRETSETRGPLSRLAEPACEYGSSTSFEMSLEFPNIEALSLGASATGLRNITFEASGLSGIQPDDNFRIDVEIEHVPSGITESAQVGEANGEISDGFIIHGPSRPTLHTHCGNIISSNTTYLAPSSLPSPSYVCLPFSPSESEMSDSESNAGESKVPDTSSHGSRRESSDLLATEHVSAFIGPSRGPSGASKHHQRANEDSDDSNDSSIDLLSFGRRFDLP
ncbi:MAG: hypothetical protein Q9195_008272 [Heterodermia aff. obscurata]